MSGPRDRIDWGYDDEEYVVVGAYFIEGEPERWNGMTGVGNPAIPDEVDYEAVYLAGDPEHTNLITRVPRPGDKLYHFHATLEAFLLEYFTGDRYESRY